MAKDTTTSFRAKTYTNKKEEARVQVSGLQAEFIKLAKGDDTAVEAFNQAVVKAIKEGK